MISETFLLTTKIDLETKQRSGTPIKIYKNKTFWKMKLKE